jgi:membrane protease subunit HflK
MGLNDPQWGNKNSGGPPDLEEVMRKLNRKIESLFGGKSGGGAPKGGSGNTPGGLTGGIGLIVLIVALVWIASGFYIVDASQRGVVLRWQAEIRAGRAGTCYPSDGCMVNRQYARSVVIAKTSRTRSKSR